MYLSTDLEDDYIKPAHVRPERVIIKLSVLLSTALCTLKYTILTSCKFRI